MRDVNNLLLAMGAPPTPGVNPYIQLIPIALVFAIFYFIILLPTKRRQKKLQTFLDALKVGDRVVTTGGIYGSSRRSTVKRFNFKSRTRCESSSRRMPSSAIKDRSRSPTPPIDAMSNLRWKLITLLVVFVVFFGVGVYPILASRYGLPAPQWLRDRQLKLARSQS